MFRGLLIENGGKSMKQGIFDRQSDNAATAEKRLGGKRRPQLYKDDGNDNTMTVERRNPQRQTCTWSNGLWAGQIGSARHSASGLWQACAYLRCIVHCSRTSSPACTSHFSAQQTICILALPSTPQSHAFQLLAMGITFSSSTRSIPCSIRSRR